MLALYIEEELTGVFSIQRDAEDDATGHLFFWIEATAWRSQNSINYLRDVLKFAMGDLGLERLLTRSSESNTLCIRALEAAGFERNGRVKTRDKRLGSEETELCFIARAKT